MDRNTILAIVLSVIVITVAMTVQTMFFTPELPTMAQESTETTAELSPSALSGRILAAQGEEPDSSPFVVESGAYTITFDPKGASVSSIHLNNHLENGNPVELIYKDPDDNNPFMLYTGGDRSTPIDASFSYSVQELTEPAITRITFTRDFTVDGSDTPFTIEKSYAIPLSSDEYLFQIAVSIRTADGTSIPLNVNSDMYTISAGPQIGPAEQSFSSSYDYRKAEVMYQGKKDKSNIRYSNGSFIAEDDVKWMSISGKYFAFILMPSNDTVIDFASAQQYSNEEGLPQENYINFTRGATGESSVVDIYSFYAGPKVNDYLRMYDTSSGNVFRLSESHFSSVIDGNWLSWLESILKWVLDLFYRFVGNYGIAIILLTILIKLLLQPIAKKGMDSTAKMSALTPKIEEIKQRFPDNPEAQNTAMAKLYKEEGINPMGSCLPMLIQFPIFIALYGLLNTNFDLRGSMFIPGWIPDLSIPDTIFTLPFGIPFLGSQIHLLPILYVISMIFSMKITQSGSTAGQQNGMIMFMTYGMPIMFFFIMYNAPSGLLLYWSTVNIISIGQQVLVNRKKKDAYAKDFAAREEEKKAKKKGKRR